MHPPHSYSYSSNLPSSYVSGPARRPPTPEDDSDPDVGVPRSPGHVSDGENDFEISKIPPPRPGLYNRRHFFMGYWNPRTKRQECACSRDEAVPHPSTIHTLDENDNEVWIPLGPSTSHSAEAPRPSVSSHSRRHSQGRSEPTKISASGYAREERRGYVEPPRPSASRYPRETRNHVEAPKSSAYGYPRVEHRGHIEPPRSSASRYPRETRSHVEASKSHHDTSRDSQEESSQHRATPRTFIVAPTSLGSIAPSDFISNAPRRGSIEAAYLRLARKS